MNRCFDFILLGAGGRGNGFAGWIYRHPEAGRLVAVAEPDVERRARIAEVHKIPASMQFERWEDALAGPRLGDVAINTLQDRLHAASGIRALDLGYHMLLEKPMAVTLADCIAIDDAQKRNNRIVSVCHSLRYHLLYQEVKRLLDAGEIGDLVSFDQLEGVETIHQSHSFVRGNWGNESRSTFMLMSKSCHDVDVLAWLAGRSCERVSSFGSLKFFRREYAPKDAPLRCTDGCPHERSCRYSAYKIYIEDVGGWASHAKVKGDTYEEKLAWLKDSPYGRCVWQTDNDVVDHQVVNFEFEGGITGTLTMTAFAPGGRYLRLHGTQGQMIGSVDENRIEVTRFSDGARKTTVIPTQPGGHGGGDSNVMDNLVHAIRTKDPEAVLTSTSESLKTHRIVFAAELARREKRVVEVKELMNPEFL